MSDATGATANSLYVPGFEANLNLSPQQTTSRLAPYVDSDFAYTQPGTFFNGDDVGTSDPQDVTSRVPDSPDGFVDVTRRFGAFKGYNDGKFIDNEDKARQLEDPTNETMAAMMAGQGRKRDTCIIAGIQGVYQYQDQNGNYQAGAANANIIASNNAKAHEAETISAVENLNTNGYGLTIGKLILTKMNLDNSELDEVKPGDKPSQYFFACTAEQLGNLLQSVPATSSFYNQIQGLIEGTLSYFMGFNFIRMPANAKFNPLPKTSYTRTCLAWHKRAVMYRARPILKTRITEREDKSFRWYAYYESEHGCFRRYDSGVWAVNCDEQTNTPYNATS